MTGLVSGAAPISTRARPRRPAYRRGRISVREKLIRWALMLVAVATVLGPLLWQLSTALKGRPSASRAP
jgi:hypothetical protein